MVHIVCMREIVRGLGGVGYEVRGSVANHSVEAPALRWSACDGRRQRERGVAWVLAAVVEIAALDVTKPAPKPVP